MGPAAGNPRHMVPQGASPASTPPRVENGSVRRGLPSRPRGRRPAGRQAPGHGSARPTAQRASSRPGAAVPKDHGVRTPSRRLAARICHSTERSIVGITSSGGSSTLPTRACFRARARAHVRVQRSFGPTHLCAGARGGHHHSSTQCQHMTNAASRSAAPPTPRSARRGARASTRATHGSARRTDRARPRTRARPSREGGPPGSARPTARAIAPRSHSLLPSP